MMSERTVQPIDILIVLNNIPGSHLILLPDSPNYTIAGATDAYLQATFLKRESAIGKGVFETLTDNPYNTEATGVSNLMASLTYVLEHKQSHRMADQRYDIYNPASEQFELRIWSPHNKPVLDAEDRVQYIIHTVEDVTEKVLLQEVERKAHQKLLENEKALRKTIELSPVAMCIFRGKNLVIEMANEPMFQFWGKRPQQVLLKPLFEAIPEAKDQGYEELMANVISTGQPFSAYEQSVTLPRKDKVEIVYINFSFVPMREADGAVTGIMATATDVTQQVAARKKMEKSEAELKRFKFMADNAQDPFILMREDGTFAYLNKKALDAWGYTKEEAKSIRVPDADPVYDAAAYKILFERAQKETIPQFDTLHRRKDGQVFPVEVNVNGITLDGQPHLFAIARDSSERSKQEAAIEAQNVLIRTITDNATSALFMMNEKGFCTFMNAAGAKMFGYTQEEIRSRELHYLIHHHRPDGSYYPMEECPLDRALPENFDVRAHRDLFFRKDGSSFPISCAASPIFEKGKPVATVIEVRDISLEMEAEQALRRSAAELEHLVGERTQNLQQVNEQLKQFTYAASHDLQEPLRKIGYFIDRLLMNLGTGLSEENKKITDRIQHTAARMRTLIDDLLAYSNTSLGVIGFEKVDLNGTVQGVLDDMEATIIEKGAEVNAQNLPAVTGDQRQLRQLFQNIISNALKYHQKEVPPQVIISSKRIQGIATEACLPKERTHEWFYLIEVADNGIGFDPDDAERIFRLFQRLHGKAEYEGTGVGLAIVQQVAENHKGFVWAESEPGKGSSFKLMLPAD